MKSSFYIYIIVILLYTNQLAFFESDGNQITKILSIIFIILNVFYSSKVLLQYKKLPSFLKGLIIFLGFLTIYGLIRILQGGHDLVSTGYIIIPSYSFLRNIYNSLLPILVFYFFSQKGYISEGLVKYFGLFFLAISIFQFFGNYNKLLENNISGETEFTNNVSYIFVMLVPFVFLLKKQLFKYIYLAILFVFVILSMKRGAILTFGCCLFICLPQLYKETKGSGRFIFILLLVTAIVGAVFFLESMMETSPYFVDRIEATKRGYTSSRDIIYGDLIDYYFYKTNLFQFIFGSGANYTTKVTINFAHQDWLELAVDCGLIGVILYLKYFINFYNTMCKIDTRFIPNYVKYILQICFVFLLLRSFFSMSYGDLGVPMALLLGFYINYINKLNKRIIQKQYDINYR